MPLKEKAISGVKWNTVATVFSMIIQILRLVVLTRFLEKSDFGLVAIATMVISFTDIFSDLGITVAIIHKQDISEKQYSSVFWLNILVSILLYAIVCGLTPFVAYAYSEDILTIIIPLLSIQILLSAVGKMFQTIKTKELEFDFLSKVKIISHTIGFLLTCLLAYLGYGVFSIVWGQLLQVAINQASYLFAGRRDHKITFHFKLSEISDILRIGVFQLGARIMDVVASKVDVLLIGKFFGMDDLGVYNLAKELIYRPVQIIQSLVNNVASSAFAKIQTNYLAVRLHFSFLLKIVTALSFPIYMCTFVFAEPIVEILYSIKFIDAAFFLRVLSVFGMFTSIESISSTLLTSYGKTNIAFYMTLVRAILSVLVVCVSSFFTIETVAYGLVLVSALCYFVYWRFAVKSTIKLPLIDYVSLIFVPLVTSIVVSVPFCIAFSIWHFPITVKLSFIAAFGGVYLAAFRIIDPCFVNEVVSLVLKRKKRSV